MQGGSRRPGPGPPHSPRPPGSRCAHRLHGGGHVVVALRLLRQSRPLQQLLSVPHVARDSASPRAPAPPAPSFARLAVRFPVTAEAAAAHAHWLAGWREAAGCAAARAFSLAGCTRSGEGRGAAERGQQEERRAGGRGGRDHACALGAARREPRERGRGGPALTVFLR